MPTIAQLPGRVSPCRIAEDSDAVASTEAPARGRLAERTRPIRTGAEFNRGYKVFRGELDRSQVIRPDAVAAAPGPPSRIEPGSDLGRKYGSMLPRWVGSPSGPETRSALGRLGRADHAAWADPGHALSCAVLTSGDPIRNPEGTRPAGSLDGSHRRTPRRAETDLAF
ncbi:hypothetical protein ABZ552_32795 [Nocardia sp. NPDC019219]|uniref:hypothetical protein n=1 Tax=Nocardia sp. NPDC019219 TaxID=3154590 RepID=UPI0033C7C888